MALLLLFITIPVLGNICFFWNLAESLKQINFKGPGVLIQLLCVVFVLICIALFFKVANGQVSGDVVANVIKVLWIMLGVEILLGVLVRVFS